MSDASLTPGRALLNSARMSKPPASAAIRLRGVRHHNLKNFDLDLPVGKLIVVTGLSGSGKSSLAFDTLFAEGQRRYIETFSPYARQFFDRMDKPRVDRIEGIPPAIAIEQRNAVRTTRSTVGTMTELTDYMKILWPHLAALHCRGCGEVVAKESPRAVWDRVNAECGMRNAESGMRPDEVLIAFDLPLSEKLSFSESLALISKQGYQRVLAGGEVVRVEDAVAHSAFRTPHSALTVVQDRLKLSASGRSRFIEACEQAYHFGKGRLTVFQFHDGKPCDPRPFSNRLHCAACDIEYREPSAAMFSFNHPLGACPACRGFGRAITINYDLAIPDWSKSLKGGAVKPWQTATGLQCQNDLARMCKARRLPMDVPFAKLSAEHQRLVIDGDPGYGADEEHQWPRAWYGVKGYFRWLESKAYKMHVRVLLSRYRAYVTCPDCAGKRFQPEALLYRMRNAECGMRNQERADLTLADFYQLPIRDAVEFVERVSSPRHRTATTDAPFRTPHSAFRTPHDPIAVALQEVRARLRYLNDIGLGYLTLDRATRTLSGGETERVNLTTCLGTRLVNTLYVLDEPSVGLHPRDTARLVGIVEQLRDLGNTVVVVEHEPAVMRAADHIVDLGPGHGESGGQIVFQGSVKELLRSRESLTGQYLSGRKQITRPVPRPVNDTTPKLRVENASAHNLKNITVDLPLGRFVCLTGVSGSGKTTFVRDVLFPLLEARFGSSAQPADDEQETNDTDSDSAFRAPHSAFLTGHEPLSGVMLVDQSSLGRTPRSNPAVYVGAFEPIRDLFAMTDEAKQRGLNSSAFSFNSAQGQCEKCRGAGFEKIEMQFLSDVFVMCPDCGGRRYREHILEVKLGAGKIISETVISNQSKPSARAKRLHTDSLITDPLITSSWSIADLLDATINEVITFLGALAPSRARDRALSSLRLLQDVGLGYLRAGQPINTLSGGESQRLKLVSHLAESHAGTTGRKLFIFDEPTTGLHFDDVRVLVDVFQRLVNDGHSLLVIEHNLELIQCADWLIDLGPDAGDGGGEVVATGTPEQVAGEPRSFTGAALKAAAPAAQGWRPYPTGQTHQKASKRRRQA